jgi:hypothetical protein
VTAAPEKPEKCLICGSKEFELSSGSGRVVGPFARSISGIYAPIPANLAFWVCKTKGAEPLRGHRQFTPELEKALRDAEDSFTRTRGSDGA